MTTLGVLAHRRKTLGDGSGELCRALADAGCSDPLAPMRIRRVLDSGIERPLVPAS
jgi:hypothetical protein